jgi:CubicO group peptidase (beta-lactamase class C family)
VLEYYGKGVYEDRLFDIHSCTKSITSSIIGMLLDHGNIDSVEQPISIFLHEIKETYNSQKRKILLKHALNMTTGIEWVDTKYIWDLAVSENPLFFVLDKSMSSAPGKAFNYNSGVSHLLSIIITRTTGISAEEYARVNLFDQIGIRRVMWSKDKMGNSRGGRGILMRPRDMARFGFLFLNNGVWDENQLISREWITKSTADQTGGFANANGYSGHYGYQWWIDSAGTENTKIIYASGYGGQYIFIAPALDLVVVFTSNLSNITSESWNPYIYFINYIIPACRETQIYNDIIVKKIDPFYYCAVEMNGGDDTISDASSILYKEIYDQHILTRSVTFMIYESNKSNSSQDHQLREVGLTLTEKITAEKPLVVKKWNHVLHVSKTVAGSADDKTLEKVVARMHDWITQHNYTVCGPLMKRLYRKPIIDGTREIERIEFLIPVEEKK